MATSTLARVRPWRWLEPWFAAYALVGLLVNGMVPIMIPLTTESKGPTVVAAVISSFFAGQLTAPLIGRFADRTGSQRIVFLGAFPAMSLAAIGFGLADGTIGWVVAALAAGVSAGAAQTLGSVFIVEGHPESEWDERIGWFRFTFGLGQVAGLAIGAAFAGGDLSRGWYLAGVIIMVGVVVGRLRLPHLHRAAPDATSTTHGAGSANGSSGLSSELHGPFGTFLLSWLLAMIAVQTILNVMPLVMRDAFGVAPSRTAAWYLVGSAIGACLYPFGGMLADRHNAGWVLRRGMVITLVAFVAMTLGWLIDPSFKDVIGLTALVVVAIGYPLDYLGATMLAAELTLDGEGSAMGLFNSAVAAGAIVGAVIPSFAARAFGYGPLPLIASGVLACALVVGLPVLRPAATQARAQRA